MSVIDRIRDLSRGRPLGRGMGRRADISVSEFGHQRYDPEILAIEPKSSAISEWRLRSGFGAPPVVPYGQRILSVRGMRFRRKLLEVAPVLNNFPMIRRVLEA